MPLGARQWLVRGTVTSTGSGAIIIRPCHHAAASPLAAAWLIDLTTMDLSPAYMMMAASAISFASILTFRESYRDA